MLTKTKSRMKEHYNCFYTFNDENLFINSSETQEIKKIEIKDKPKVKNT